MIDNRHDEDFLFIVGCPRSGTYLLSMIINHHFSVAVPTETHFIPLFQRFLRLWGDLSKRANRRRLVGDILEFLEIWAHVEATGRDYERELAFSLLAARDRAGQIVDNSGTYRDIVCGLFGAYAALRGKRLCGDKSAFAAPVPLETLDKCVHRAKVIHIVRDGRDVSRSWRNLWCGLDTVAGTARLWARHVAAKRQWGQAHRDRYLEVRYEDLLDDPKGTIGRIGEFLHLPVENAETSFAQSEFAQALGSGRTHPMVSKPLDPGNKYKYRDEMSPADQQLFVSIAGDVLADCGYDLPAEHRRGGAGLALRRSAQQIREWLRWRRMQYGIKHVMPLIIFLLGRVGVRPSRFIKTPMPPARRPACPHET